MTTTRNPDNIYGLVDWTKEINEVPNQYGFINNSGLFQTSPVAATSVVFDKIESSRTLLSQASRSARNATQGKDRDVTTFSLPLAYYKHENAITSGDIQNQRMAGTANEAETVGNAIALKMQDLRLDVDQTLEYMQFKALTGVATDADGIDLADMYTLFGITQETENFNFGTDEVNTHIADMKRTIGANLKGAGQMVGVDVYCSDTFFDTLVTDDAVEEKYLSTDRKETFALDTATYENWGVYDVFVHKGVRFLNYNPTFVNSSGVDVQVITDGEGYAVPRMAGGQSIFRGHYGPSNKLSQTNRPGSKMYSWTYRDEKDEYIDAQVETAPLFFTSKPAAIMKVSAS